jgi:hypothetical protein
MNDVCGICGKKFGARYTRTVRSSFILALKREKILSCVDEDKNMLNIPLGENCLVHTRCDNQEMKRITSGEISPDLLWPDQVAA